VKRPCASDGREVLLALRRPAGAGAAFGQHGDLGAEVVGVAADGGLLVLVVRAQEPLQHPSAPLTLNLRLYLQEETTGWTNRMKRTGGALRGRGLQIRFRDVKEQIKEVFFVSTYLAVQEAVQDCNDKTLKKKEGDQTYPMMKKRKTNTNAILQLGKPSKCLCLNNDGKIRTSTSGTGGRFIIQMSGKCSQELSF